MAIGATEALRQATGLLPQKKIKGKPRKIRLAPLTKGKHFPENPKYMAGHILVAYDIIQDGQFWRIKPYGGSPPVKDLQGRFTSFVDAERKLIQWIKKHDKLAKGIYPGAPSQNNKAI